VPSSWGDGQLDCHAAFTHVGDGAQLSGASFTWMVTGGLDRDWRYDSVRASSARTARKRFMRSRKAADAGVGSQVAAASTHSRLAGRMATASARCSRARNARPSTREAVRWSAVHDDCLKPSAGQFVNGRFGVGGQLHADLQFLKTLRSTRTTLSSALKTSANRLIGRLQSEESP
jgi:hypothetical protein